MNKILLIAAITLIPFLCMAQTKINGIGLFKLGALKSEVLDSIVSITGLQITYNSSTYEQCKNKLNKINGIFQCLDLGKGNHCPLYDMYIISEVSIYNIMVEDIQIDFYNDTLYSIICPASRDLMDSIKVKYGEGILRHRSKIIYCQDNITGAKTEHEESDFATVWRFDHQVSSYENLRSYYNDECKEVYDDWFFLKDLKIEKKEQDCHDKEIKKEVNKSIKDKLK